MKVKNRHLDSSRTAEKSVYKLIIVNLLGKISSCRPFFLRNAAFSLSSGIKNLLNYSISKIEHAYRQLVVHVPIHSLTFRAQVVHVPYTKKQNYFIRLQLQARY
jgi:hypothetical protein